MNVRLQSHIISLLPVLAHVPMPHPHHFVLVTGYVGGTTFSVHDPYNPYKTYDYANIHDILLYDVLPNA